MDKAIQEKLRRHDAFWRGEMTKRPMIGFQVGSYFMAQRYQAAAPLLQLGKRITPEMLDPREFLADYERQYQYTLEIGQDAFFAAEPYTGIPWMEGILGCPISATVESMWADHWLADWTDMANLKFDPDNPWFRKFIEFVDVLAEYSKGRFPIAQPILRGPSDMVGAVIGQSRLPLEVYDNPEQVKQLANIATDAFIQVVDALQHHAPAFHGGYSIGFYHLWAPEHVIWYQEDLSALLSPRLFRDLFLDCGVKISQYASYNALHVHPSSFFMLDDFLKIEPLKVIQINKDVGGPSIPEMLPQFQKVLESGKKLIIWGSLDQEDLLAIVSQLPKHSTYIDIVAETVDEGKQIMEYARELEAKNDNSSEVMKGRLF